MNKVKRLLTFLISLILKGFVSIFSPFLIFVGFLDKFVLVRMDGGICSQMHFYLIGNLFKKRGFKVKYNLDWYTNEGLDMNGQFVRNFDLLKAFPYLEFESASKIERFFYKAFEYKNDYNDINKPFIYTSLIPPLYLTGYFRDPIGLYEDSPSLFQIDYSILDYQNQRMLTYIEQRIPSVAIHVRRGDLASFNPAYGAPVNSCYINNAIDFIESNAGKSTYFIFSDEPEWVRQELVSYLKIGRNYFVVDINGSDKGYYDLFLISACNHHITSKGSLGKYGAFLSNKSGIITVYDDEYEKEKWEGLFPNIYFIRG